MDEREIQEMKRDIDSLKHKMAEAEDVIRALIQQLTAKRLIKLP